MKYTLFISDLHLQESDLKKTNLFLRFLNEKALQADAIYILGDLFEAWIGDDNNSKFNIKIKNALKQFTRSRVPLYFMRGNRDFLIGKKFILDTGCKFIEDPHKINLYGISTLLTHGDILCTNDINHIRFHKYAYNAKYNRIFLILPLKLRKLIATFIRIKSNKNKNRKSDAIKKIPTESIIKMLEQHNVNQIIHGHTHVPGLHYIVQKKWKHFVLGSWENKASILIYYQNHNYVFSDSI